MKSTNDNPIDSLGTLGPVIRDKAPSKPDPVSDFTTKKHELINNQSNAMETIAETLKKSSLPIVSDGQLEDWEGICFEMSPYEVQILSSL